jgi:hypothetical protein
MSNYTDDVICMALKKGAANHHAPVNGKMRLLSSVGLLNCVAKSEATKLVFQIPESQYKRKTPQSVRKFPIEQFIELIDQTRLWLLHISPSSILFLA